MEGTREGVAEIASAFTAKRPSVVNAIAPTTATATATAAAPAANPGAAVAATAAVHSHTVVPVRDARNVAPPRQNGITGCARGLCPAPWLPADVETYLWCASLPSWLFVAAGIMPCPARAQFPRVLSYALRWAVLLGLVAMVPLSVVDKWLVGRLQEVPVALFFASVALWYWTATAFAQKHVEKLAFKLAPHLAWASAVKSAACWR